MEEDGEAAAEAANELSRLLETDSGSEISMTKVRFIEYPYSWPLIFGSSMTSTSYITINGNEDSCGSSFADLDASAMASIDVRTISYISHGLFSEVFRSDIREVVGLGARARRENHEEQRFFDFHVFSEADDQKMLARFQWDEDVDMSD